MWLIEFFEGNLKNIILPIDDELILSGSNLEEKNCLYIPEYFPKNYFLSISINNNKPTISTSNKKQYTIIKDNVIYKKSDLVFTIYKEGHRKPKLIKYKIKKYWLIVPIILSITLMSYFLTDQTLFMFKKSYIKEKLNIIDSAYIKNGYIYLFNDEEKNLPIEWIKNIKYIDPEDEHVSQFNIKLVSSYRKNPIKYKVVSHDDYDEIIVNTYEIDNKLMQLFNRNGILYKKTNGYWYVDNLEKAKNLLKDKKLYSIAKKLLPNNKITEFISKNNFPYSVFYSSTSGGYIYNKKIRYWIGSDVPYLGIIKNITAKKVIFEKNKKTRVYLIK